MTSITESVSLVKCQETGQYGIFCLKPSEVAAFSIFNLDGSGTGNPWEQGNVEWRFTDHPAMYYPEGDEEAFKQACKKLQNLVSCPQFTECMG